MPFTKTGNPRIIQVGAWTEISACLLQAFFVKYFTSKNWKYPLLANLWALDISALSHTHRPLRSCHIQQIQP